MTFRLHRGKTVPCNLKGPIDTSLWLFWWFGTLLLSCLEIGKFVSIEHKMQLCTVRDVDNLILCGQGEHYCPVMFLAGMGDKPPCFLKMTLFQTNLV